MLSAHDLLTTGTKYRTKIYLYEIFDNVIGNSYAPPTVPSVASGFQREVKGIVRKGDPTVSVFEIPTTANG